MNWIVALPIYSNYSFRLLLMVLIMTSVAHKVKAQAAASTAYLFAYFTGNGPGEEAIRFALSDDGFNYRALNNNQPVLNSEAISAAGGVRDPHILRAQDGKTFYMVATDMQVAKNDWGPNYGLVMLKSSDLINWVAHQVHIPSTFKAFEAVSRVWAPQTIYDPTAKRYMLYWSMRFGNGPDIIYYAYANKDFGGLATEPKQLLFLSDNQAAIDGDIIFKAGKYHLFYKTEGAGNGIKKAVSSHINKNYVLKDRYLQQTTDPVEGAGIFKLKDSGKYILMYDVYTKGKYQFTESTDLETFKVIDEQVSMDFHPRHGTVIPITADEAMRLREYWKGKE